MYILPFPFKLVWQSSIINYLKRSFGQKWNEIAKSKQNKMKEKSKRTTAVSKCHTSPTTSTGTHASCFSVTVFPLASDPHRHVNGRVCSVLCLILAARGSLSSTLSGDPGWKTLGSWEKHNTDQPEDWLPVFPAGHTGGAQAHLPHPAPCRPPDVCPQKAHTTSPNPVYSPFLRFLFFFPQVYWD